MNRQYGSAAADREYDDPAFGLSGGSSAPVGAFGEDAQRPPFGQEGQGGAYRASSPTLAVDREGPDELEEHPERKDEELLFRHPLQATGDGHADQNGVGILGVVGGHYQGSIGRHTVTPMDPVPEQEAAEQGHHPPEQAVPPRHLTRFSPSLEEHGSPHVCERRSVARSRTLDMTSSRLKDVVSRTTASEAGLRGEISRSESWRSRLAKAALMRSNSPSLPVWYARLRARSSGAADR